MHNIFVILLDEHETWKVATSFRDVLSIESPAQYCCQCQCDVFYINIRSGCLSSARLELYCILSMSTATHTHTRARAFDKLDVWENGDANTNTDTYNEWHELLNWCVCIVPRQNRAKSNGKNKCSHPTISFQFNSSTCLSFHCEAICFAFTNTNR